MADKVDDSFDEEVATPDDIDVVDLETLEEGDDLDDEPVDEELVDEDLVDEVLVDDELADPALDVDVEDVVVEGAVVVPAVVPAAEDDEDDDDEDDVADPDDVEASLDVILKDRLVVVEQQEDEEEEEEEVPDTDDRAEGAGKILPKRPDEFVCQSCFLVKHPSQLDDPVRMYCRDCV